MHDGVHQQAYRVDKNVALLTFDLLTRIVARAPGLEAALSALWGDDLPVQRCTVHKHRNLLGHAPKRRLSGKSDPIDAEHAARTVLSGSGTAAPKLANGQIEAVRVIKIPRDTAVKARTAAIITLKAVLVTVSDELRIELESLTDHKLIIVCAALETNGNMSDPHVATRYTLAHLAQRWFDLHEEIKVHGVQLKVLTKTAAPKMPEQFGVDFDTAAEVLIAAGDNTDRIRSEAAFAKLCGVCPIPAGSGKTSGRHRLNRGGNRQANAALYRDVIVRLRWHPPTITYVKRRKADGLSKKDIIRCLERFVARELYHLLPEPSLPLEATSTPSPT